MMNDASFDIFLVVAPGLESVLCKELQEKGFADPKPENGGVTFRGGWSDVWRANLEIRGATRVLARIGSFRAIHLSQLDKLAHKFPWADFLRDDVAVKVDASCKKSRIYHSGAVVQRIERAIREELGAAISDNAGVRIMARLENNVCTLSIDTSGELLHRRGYKEAVGKAPMRETLASLFLAQCGFSGTEPVVDPMCGSGTFILEAAEIASDLNPGRARHFAFEHLSGFNEGAWQALKSKEAASMGDVPRFFGFDRDAGAIRMSAANAEKAGVVPQTQFQEQSISDLRPPEELGQETGLVMVNPPYGARIGDKKGLHALYGTLGKVLMARFSGWRVGLITTDPQLAQSTRLRFKPAGAAIDHGGLKIRLYRSGPLD